jgi:cation/acetate symporter
MLPRLMVVWVAIAATALSAGVFLALADIDVMQAGIRAFALAAATFFPGLLLAIWWRRCSRLGAMLALGMGFAAMATELAFGGTVISGLFSLTPVAAALIGVALGLIAGLVGSLLGPKPSPAAQAYFDELRDPTGDSLYERAQRRAAAAAASQ